MVRGEVDVSAKHDDNGGYPHDTYPNRRKIADRRERDRDEADRRAGARLREAIRVAEIYDHIPAERPKRFAPDVRTDERLPRGVAVAAGRVVIVGQVFPLDPRSVCRDEMVRRAYENETRR